MRLRVVNDVGHNDIGPLDSAADGDYRIMIREVSGIVMKISYALRLNCGKWQSAIVCYMLVYMHCIRLSFHVNL